MKLLNENSEAIEAAAVPADSIGVLSSDRMKILMLLADEPMYPAQLARRMDMSVQSVYYHIKLLEDAGLARFTEYEERKGGVAKKYEAVAESLAIVLQSGAWQKHVVQKQSTPEILRPFISKGAFNGRIVMGSPDPHGQHRARGSELCMVEFGALLGRYASFNPPLYTLDTQLRDSGRNKNLILAGGPKVNMIVSEVNKSLSIRFSDSGIDIQSKLSGKRYGENVGIVELIENPFNRNSSLLLLGGLNQHGTRAAVLSLIQKMPEICEGNMYDSNSIAKVVEGFDDNGDGIVDTVEMLE
jgi:DNA-binding transcriptional ArsR family regulator